MEKKIEEQETKSEVISALHYQDLIVLKCRRDIENEKNKRKNDKTDKEFKKEHSD